MESRSSLELEDLDSGSLELEDLDSGPLPPTLWGCFLMRINEMKVLCEAVLTIRNNILWSSSLQLTCGSLITHMYFASKIQLFQVAYSPYETEIWNLGYANGKKNTELSKPITHRRLVYSWCVWFKTIKNFILFNTWSFCVIEAHFE